MKCGKNYKLVWHHMCRIIYLIHLCLNFIFVFLHLMCVHRWRVWSVCKWHRVIIFATYMFCFLALENIFTRNNLIVKGVYFYFLFFCWVIHDGRVAYFWNILMECCCFMSLSSKSQVDDNVICVMIFVECDYYANISFLISLYIAY